MFKLRLFSLASFLFMILAVTRDCFADWRRYVWTYEYMTMYKGSWEVEYYLTSEVPDKGRSNVNTLKQWLELEYGITDRWDISMYQMWKYKNKIDENDSEYDGFKIRTRYRFGEKGQFIFDPLIYAEYIRDDDFSKPNVGEAKIILAKDIGNLNFSYNQILKRNLEKEGKTAHEYAFGINYKLLPRFRFGMESKGNFSSEKYAVGPTLTFATKNLWATFGAVFALNSRTDDVQSRIIIGIPF